MPASWPEAAPASRAAASARESVSAASPPAAPRWRAVDPDPGGRRDGRGHSRGRPGDSAPPAGDRRAGSAGSRRRAGCGQMARVGGDGAAVEAIGFPIPTAAGEEVREVRHRRARIGVAGEGRAIGRFRLVGTAQPGQRIAVVCSGGPRCRAVRPPAAGRSPPPRRRGLPRPCSPTGPCFPSRGCRRGDPRRRSAADPGRRVAPSEADRAAMRACAVACAALLRVAEAPRDLREEGPARRRGRQALDDPLERRQSARQLSPLEATAPRGRAALQTDPGAASWSASQAASAASPSPRASSTRARSASAGEKTGIPAEGLVGEAQRPRGFGGFQQAGLEVRPAVVVPIETGGLAIGKARGSAEPMGMEHHAEAPPVRPHCPGLRRGRPAPREWASRTAGSMPSDPTSGISGPPQAPASTARSPRRFRAVVNRKARASVMDRSGATDPRPRPGSLRGAGNASSEPSDQRTARLSIAAPAGIPKWARGSPELR